MSGVAGSKRALLLVPALVLAIFAFSASPVFAASPWWNLNMSVRPATIPTSGEGTIIIRASNLGNAKTSAPATLSATMPAGVSVQGVTFFSSSSFNYSKSPGTCQTSATSASCTTAKLEEGKILPLGLNLTNSSSCGSR